MTRSIHAVIAAAIAASIAACATTNRPVVYHTSTGKRTPQLVPLIAEIARTKGFVVAREDADAGRLVVARPDRSFPMVVLVQPDSLRRYGRGACLVNASCWTWFVVRPLSTVDDKLVEWNDAPDTVQAVAGDLAMAINRQAQ